jgi:hypothetical protein
MSAQRLVNLSAAAIVAIVIAGASRADAACDRYQTVPDGRIRGPIVISNGTNDVGMFFQGVLGKSYSVEVMVTSAQFDAGTVSVNFGAANVTCPGSDLGGIRRTEVIDPAPQTVQNNFFRASFTAPSTAFYMVRAGNISATAVEVTVSVSETTLYSPVWSTIGFYNTFYSLYNTTRSTCSGTLTLYNTAGTPQTTANVTVASGATASTNTSAMGTARGLTGTAKFIHDCPPGGFLAEAGVADFSTVPPYFQFVHLEGTREAKTH